MLFITRTSLRKHTHTQECYLEKNPKKTNPPCQQKHISAARRSDAATGVRYTNTNTHVRTLLTSQDFGEGTFLVSQSSLHGWRHCQSTEKDKHVMRCDKVACESKAATSFPHTEKKSWLININQLFKLSKQWPYFFYNILSFYVIKIGSMAGSIQINWVFSKSYTSSYTSGASVLSAS